LVSRQDDPHAEERFKDCDCLSDSDNRRKCNEFGLKESAPEGYIDTKGVHVFGTIFGGERFVPIIGTINLAKDFAGSRGRGSSS